MTSAMPETTPVTEMGRCRFCGGPSYRHEADKDFHGGVAIGCATCGALGPMQDEADFDDDAAMWVAAEEAWNTAALSTRTPEAAQVEILREALVGAREHIRKGAVNTDDLAMLATIDTALAQVRHPLEKEG